jgi:hypothetical protein
MKQSEGAKRKLTRLKDEEWREISGTKGLYFVSNYGRVKSFVRDGDKGRLMKQSQVKGFLCINIKREDKYCSFLVHKLVAEAFVEKSTELHTFVSHLDKNVKNNKSSNLVWITREENYTKVMELLNNFNRNRPGKFAPYTKLKAEDVRHIKGMIQLGVKQKVIAKMFCVSEMQITRIKQGVNWSEINVEEFTKK